MKNVEQIIKGAFEDREKINKDTHGEIREAVEYTLNKLDNGSIRVSQKIDGNWIVNQWIKKAILLSTSSTCFLFAFVYIIFFPSSFCNSLFSVLLGPTIE